MRKKQSIPQYLRVQVFKRDNYTCQYCGRTDAPLHADHVYPESKGGETSLANLITSCGHCNHKKHNKVGMWPRKILEVERTITVTETETITITKKPVAGRWAIFLSTQVLVFGVVYGGFTHTNIAITLLPSVVMFVVGFVLMLIGV